MKISKFLLAVILLAVFSVAFAADPQVPDPKLTPGAVLTTDTKVLCVPGYSATVRHTSEKTKAHVYHLYGIDKTQGHYEVDHLISLELGGADVEKNLWPQSYETQPYNAHIKDHLENYLHAEVCAGRMSIEQAQKDIATDWIGAYEKYLGRKATAPKSPHPKSDHN